MMNSGPRRGRRPGKPDTRVQILDVARRRFLEEGYQAVTMRSVATEAGVDLALVSYYFGSKKGLLGATLALAANPADILGRAVEGDSALLPERALRSILSLWEDSENGAPLRVLVAGAFQDTVVANLVKEMLEVELIDLIAARIGGANARKRAAAFFAQIAGLVLARYILRLEPMASMSSDEIIQLYVPPLRVALRT
ncbi:TetR/AcrR family transcriptional regulator [Mycolicibacterium holsaticum]|uniref:TetR/AcrR family transcriptional regulator n=1 Tax=Mycolicibacterium holsaticum TaxID=152142 RepID=UPI001E62F376|nr:TetR family transcriptional regulator [Mycolicibacterium holsaticum]MDA4108537.1 transcriptional regulator [Mycolicibacterium holsaticum DSM 44478 = JCM 12374]UNC09804.1 TetR/AcrR family transcriptional regulator [Mycolicibacterium holsaticum DSM 44478 = JCM 12374]